MNTIAKVLSEYREREGFDPRRTADCIDVEYSSLMRILNPHDKYDLGIRKLIPFLEATRDLTLLDHIEAHFGRVAVSVRAERGCKMDFTGVCRFMKEAGEAMSAVGDAVKDGRVSAAEAARCRKELTELLQVCSAMMAELNRIEGA